MKGRKVLASALALTSITGSAVPAFATEVNPEVNYDNVITADDLTSGSTSASTKVIINGGKSTFTATLPKTMDGTSVDGSINWGYDVNVRGDIAGMETVKVVPDASFALMQSGKADITTSITQTKTVWNVSELAANEGAGTTSNGSVSANGITAGNWKGTFNFNIKLESTGYGITVTATNEAGEDINATANTIEYTQKEMLLNKLEESGLIDNKADVDALIEVKSDDFAGLATTTFDVSSIAKEGDTVVILHFDETKQQWEHIGTETVTNGTVTGDFTSYSPVAFVVIKEDGTQEVISLKCEHTYENHICTKCQAYEAGLYDSNNNFLKSISKEQVETNYPYNNTLPASLGIDTTKIAKVVIPEGTTSIGKYAFRECLNLTSITIPSSVTSIDMYAFRDCKSLRNITIPSSVTHINSGAFYNTPWLAAKRAENPLVIVNGILIDGKTASGNVVIPEGVTSIGDFAFGYCESLTSITLPNSLQSIGDMAFENCTSLTNITIPSSVQSIGSYAFSGCTSLTNITIPNSVTSIGDYAFNGCTSLTDITIPDSVTSIGYYLFTNCTKLTSATIPSNMTNIINGTFFGCTSLTDITIPDSVTCISPYAFYNCTSLTNISIPDSVQNISAYAFEGCTSLTNVIISNGVTSIGASAFANCPNLTSVTFENPNGWYIGDTKGTKTTALSSSDLSNKSTAATYLKETYRTKYWTRE